MYNHFLDTFIRAAELGSLSKTAEEMYITPSAVIQQINSLEKDLNVKLFNRSKKGVTLTPEGEYLLTEGRSFIEREKDIRRHLSEISQLNRERILVACNPFHMPQMLYELWPSFYLKNPECELSSYTFSEYGTLIREDTDIIEGLYFNEPRWQNNYQFYKIRDVGYCFMVSMSNPLARHNLITWTDLIDTTVLNIINGISKSNDAINADIIRHDIHLEYTEAYSSSSVIQALAKGYAIVMPECWGILHPGNKMLKFTWNYTDPYGFFLSDTASASARKFLKEIGV